MKKFTYVIVFSLFSFAAFAQIPVDTMPNNKNVLLEEFTGVDCNSCPQGHIEIANLITAYPNRIYAAGMHSFSTGHTTPYPGDEDLRRQFPDALRTQIPDLYGIPGGIISRRASTTGKECYIFWPFNGYHQPLDSACNKIMSEPSPFNIGIDANYDTVNKILTVNSQVYTTISKTQNFKINVFITQSNIFVSQLNGNTVIPNYNQQHVFREVITPTWGAAMYPTGTNAGDVFNHSITFNNASKNYKMQDVEVLVFVTDHTTTTNSKGHVINVKGMHVNLTGPTGVNEMAKEDNFSIYPNPSENVVNIHISKPSLDNMIYMHDLNGKLVLQKEIGLDNNNIINHQLAPGMYFISVKNNPGVIQKLIVQ